MDIANFELQTFYYLVLFFIAIFAGFIDSIVGGGGLITLPALMASGLPPHLALATNKLQSVFGSFTASLTYFKSRSMKHLAWGVFFHRAWGWFWSLCSFADKRQALKAYHINIT